MPEIVFSFEQGGQLAQVTFEISGEPDLALAAQAVRTAVWDNLRSETSTDCTLQTITARDSGGSQDLVVDEQGQGPGAAVPVNCAFLVTKVTPVGRNGRFFWPGLRESSVDAAGRLGAGTLTSMQASLDSVMTDLAAAGIAMNVRTSPTVLRVATSLSVGTIIGRQGRRLR